MHMNNTSHIGSKVPDMVLNVKESISTQSIKEMWSVDLLKCVDASPVVVLKDDIENLECQNDSVPLLPGKHLGKSSIKDKFATVYIGSHSGVFMAVNLNDGSVIWKQRLGGKIVQ